MTAGGIQVEAAPAGADAVPAGADAVVPAEPHAHPDPVLRPYTREDLPAADARPAPAAARPPQGTPRLDADTSAVEP